MTKNQQKTIGLVLVDKFADWEFGLLSAGAAENLGAKVLFLSPDGLPVTSIGGLEARPSRGITPEENGDLDAVALIGSDTWAEKNAPDVAPLLAMVQKRGGVIGGIFPTVGLRRDPRSLRGTMTRRTVLFIGGRHGAVRDTAMFRTAHYLWPVCSRPPPPNTTPRRGNHPGVVAAY